MARPCRPKLRYGSWDEAQLALVDCKIRTALRGSRRRRELRSYWCGLCLGWHLTSTPDRPIGDQIASLSSTRYDERRST